MSKKRRDKIANWVLRHPSAVRHFSDKSFMKHAKHVLSISSFRSKKEYEKCSRKIKHDNILSAMQHIKSLEQADYFRRPGKNKLMSVYACTFCDGLHVGGTDVFRLELKEGEFEFKEQYN